MLWIFAGVTDETVTVWNQREKPSSPAWLHLYDHVTSIFLINTISLCLCASYLCFGKGKEVQIKMIRPAHDIGHIMSSSSITCRFTSVCVHACVRAFVRACMRACMCGEYLTMCVCMHCVNVCSKLINSPSNSYH